MVKFQLQPFLKSDYKIYGELFFKGKDLSLDYFVSGDIGSLIVPEVSSKPQFKDELWKTTCMELFMSQTGHKDYFEFNFSPSLNFAYYEFSNFRERAPDPEIIPKVKIERTQDDKILHLKCQVVFPSPLSGKYDCAVTGILEDSTKTCQFFALKHGPKPEFHKRELFLLEL